MSDDRVPSGHSQGSLAEGDERYRLIVENARDYAIFTADLDGIIDSWPPGAESVFGWPAEAIIGKPAALLFVPEDREAGAPEQEFETALRYGRAPDVRWHQHRNGARVFIEGAVWPIAGDDGAPKGFLKIGQDMTLRRRSEIALVESEERFRLLATTVPHLVFRSTACGRRTWASPQWAAYTGMSDVESEGFGWLEAIHPDDRERAVGSWSDASSDGESYYGEHRIRRWDGHYRWHQSRAVPLRDSGENTEEWVGSAADIHDMRELQERQTILVGELQHRTRNLLAVVRSLAVQTVDAVETLDDFRTAFDNRLGALSRVQGLLSRTDARPVTVEQLLRIELGAVASSWDRITLEGPVVLVADGSLQTLMLVIHELSTNAVRHGGLASPAGRLAVTWSKAEGGGEAGLLIIDWREEFPRRRIDPARPRGFGRQLIEEAIPYQLEAQTEFRLEEGSLHCILTLPLDSQDAP